MDKRTYQDRKDYFKEYYRSYYENNPDYRKQQRERAVAKGIENRKAYHEWKSTLACVYCGERESCCLEFHHLDPKSKDYELSKISSKSIKFILREAAKCVVLCSNCHKKLHAGVIKLEEPSLPS